MMNPSRMKIFMMLREVAPIARRMAISLCFSMTTMISVVAMLKAATRTMIPRTMNNPSFSSRRAERKEPNRSSQERTV